MAVRFRSGNPRNPACLAGVRERIPLAHMEIAPAISTRRQRDGHGVPGGVPAKYIPFFPLPLSLPLPPFFAAHPGNVSSIGSWVSRLFAVFEIAGGRSRSCGILNRR